MFDDRETECVVAVIRHEEREYKDTEIDTHGGGGYRGRGWTEQQK